MIKLKNFILLKMLYRKNAYYVTETGLMRTLFLAKFPEFKEKTYVTSNTLSYIYETGRLDDKKKPIIISLQKMYHNHFKFITISHNYPHKNLSIIPKVGRLLEEQGKRIVFFVTFEDAEYDKMSTEFKQFTHNLGVIPVSDVPYYYELADALFLPTLIECFTVSYLEAMFHKIPILTSDLDFAHALCGDAALYFDPFHYEDVAKKAFHIIESEIARKKLVEAGSLKLAEYPNSKQRVNNYVAILKSIVS